MGLKSSGGSPSAAPSLRREGGTALSVIAVTQKPPSTAESTPEVCEQEKTSRCARPALFSAPRMRERARQLDGRLTIHSVPGAGTLLMLQLPCKVAA